MKITVTKVEDDLAFFEEIFYEEVGWDVILGWSWG